VISASNRRRRQTTNLASGDLARDLAFERPASRLSLIYAIAIGAFQGSFFGARVFLNARFQVTAETIGYFFMYIGSISVFARVLLLGAGRLLGEANLSRLGLVLLAGGRSRNALSQNLGMLALAVR